MGRPKPNKVINQGLCGFKNLEKPGKQQFGPWKNLENTLEKPGIGPLVRSGNPEFDNYLKKSFRGALLSSMQTECLQRRLIVKHPERCYTISV